MSNGSINEKTTDHQYTADHLRYFADRCIPIADANKAGFRSMSRKEVELSAKRLGLPVVPSGGLLMPYPTALDEIQRCRLRLDDVVVIEGEPGVNEHRGEDLPRYVTQKGVEPIPYLTPTLPRSTWSDTSIPLHIVEAPPKALSMTAAGFPAIGLAGVEIGAVDVEQWRKNKTVSMHRELARIAWKGRRAVVMFDAGITNNPRVALGAAKLTYALESEGANVYLAILPLYTAHMSGDDYYDPKDQGPDDYLHRNGLDALRRIIEDAGPASPAARARRVVQLPREQWADAAKTLLHDMTFVAALYVGGRMEIANVATIWKPLGIGKRELAEKVNVFAGRIREGAPEQDEKYHPTDKGNAERLIDKYGSLFRYVPQLGEFVVWDDRRFVRDAEGLRVRAFAKKVIEAMHEEAKELTGDAAEQLRDHATRSESLRAITAMVEGTKDDRRILIDAKVLDADLWLFNCNNGTLDLRTGSLRPHSPADLITKLAPVDYIKDAPRPLHQQYLERVQPDPEIRHYLQLRDGSKLVGLVRDQVFDVHHGAGGGGKGTRTRYMSRILGDYAAKVPRSIFEKTRNEQHPADKMMLFGLRFAYGTEADPHLNVDQIKELTGNDAVTARGMGMDWLTFEPTYQLEMQMNKPPVIREAHDDGIWRRLRIVPWTVAIPDAEQDKELDVKLKAEDEGILAWLVEGCLAWQRDGLPKPPAIVAATQTFKASQDDFANFLDECFEVRDPARTDAVVLSEDIRGALVAFVADGNVEGRMKTTNQYITSELQRRGFTKLLDGKSRRAIWKGLALRRTELPTETLVTEAAEQVVLPETNVLDEFDL
ncbi:MAG: DUF3854 domain-containing protein [Deltaproteobacteria bacterium]|nr:DUF3854 domain-containing protein [Deltaproteobacteria bacterium]